MYLGQTQNMLMYYLFKLWNRTRVKKIFGKKLIHNKMKKKSFSLIYGIIIQKPRKSAFCNFSFFQFYVFDIRFLFFLFYSIVRGPQKFENIFPLVLTFVFLSTKGKNFSNFVTFSQYLNFNNLIAHALKRHRSGVLLWRQILKRQLLHQMFVRKFLILSLLFFLSNLKYISNKGFQNKMWIKMAKLFSGETIFQICKHQCLFFMFSLLRFIWRTFDVIIDVQYLTL
jgi:hypothetical protein